MMAQNKTALEYAQEVRLNGMTYNQETKEIEPLKVERFDDNLTQLLLKERVKRIKDVPDIEYLTDKEVMQGIDKYS